MKENAYAKINLSLDVVRKRDDGYHELSMIMLPLFFYDVLDMEISETMSFTQNVRFIPTDNNNTVIKAINIMKETFNLKENFSIKLVKHIPTQAGLAGGSADGAAAMRLVKKLLNLKVSDRIMIDLAKKVGADVPFCYKNKPALVEGIGEKLSFFSINADFPILLVKPKKGISTKMAFSRLDFNKCVHPDTLLMKKALMENDYQQIIANLGNSLEQPSFEMVESIKEIKDEMIALGFDGALMSGSGSTVFGISKDLNLIKKVHDYFKAKNMFVRITSIKK